MTDDWTKTLIEMKSEIPPDFMYRDPITGDATNGYGEIPLPWGEYPEGMDVDGEEAAAYDLNRGRILMIPSQTFDQQNLGKIVAQEQGTELNDPHFITASRILHNYLNKSKSDINKRPSWLPVDVAQSAIDQRETSLDSEYYANWGHSFMNRFNMNLTAMGVNTGKLYDAPPGVHRAMYYLLETFDREGMTAGNIAKGFGNLAMDPFSWVGLSTLGFGALGKAGLKKVTKETLSAFLQDSMSKNAGKLAISIAKAPTSAIGLEAGFYTAADNLMRQNVAIQANQQDGPNYAEAASMFGVGLGGGNVLKNVMDVAPGAVSSAVTATKNKLSDMGENAQTRLDAGENTTTLSSMGGGEIDKAIDTGLAHMQNKKTGQYIGGPQGLDSPKKLASLRIKAKKLAEEGESGKFWYERSGKAILDAVGGNIDEADKIIQAIAVTSPSTPVKSNFDYAIQAYSAYKAGNPIKTGRFPTAMSARLEKIFAGEEWVGRKTDDFYNNLMVHIDPSRSGPVTGDLWMMRAFGFAGDMASQKQYEFVTKETQRLAGELGWEPHQVQAAMWVAQKAKSEGKPISAASYDYSTALQESLAQISWESIPGRTSSHMLEMFDAPLEVKSAYHVDISKAFLDENGTDVIAKELGLVSPGDFEAPGYFEGLVSPGTQTEVAAPRQYKGPKYGEVDSSTVELINAYATARGILMKQDGVGWHRPFFNPAKKDANGIDLRVGRKFSEKETAQLADILKELSGHSEYNPIATENGVRILNFDYLDFDNKEFAKLIEKAYNRLELDDNANIDPVLFNSQNGYVANNWSVNKNGEEYTNALRGTGRPNIHGKVLNIIKKLQSRIDDVDAEYSEKYGFTRNQEINSQFRSEDTSGVNLDAPVERGADGN
ncbi:MAG: hypothetical protein Unbinned4509contig1000_19 [Prokaryotic dsDNA virus sp.]|nr:MAG: hypothetical protein Unbinned4509contig1000_19 [Prokaryotic dsDNA virus sp.]